MTRQRLPAIGLACLTAATSGPVSPALAEVRTFDEQPTPAECAALGFEAQPGPQPYYGRMRNPAVSYAPAPPPPPPPMAMAQPVPSIPPLPVPPVANRVAPAGPAEEVIVSSSRRPPGVPVQARDTERYPGAVANPIRQTASEPVSTFSVDVDTASYANVRRFINEGGRVPADAVRVEELVNYFDYGYARPKDRSQPFSTYVALAPSPWSAERQILHIGIQGYDLTRAEPPPLNLVFLIDTSGSMSGPDRLPLAQKSLSLLIGQLRPQDRVSMVAYAGSAGAVLGPTSGREKLKMRCALTALHAGGSTAGGQGLELAYALAKERFDPKGVNRVILVTDGDFNVGIADPSRLKDFVAEKRKGGVYLSVYGFGRGNYNDTMMQALAQNGNGTAAYVDSLQEARKLFREDFTKSLFPIADDVKIQVEFNPAQVSEYRLIGYETRMLAREDFNNDQVDAGEVGAGASVTALYEITPTGAKPSADPLRYGRPAPTPGPSRELAFLKIRYKLPGERTSKLIERPIGRERLQPSLAAAPEQTRWAVAVAGFGQKLKQDPRVSDSFGWDQVISLAQTARGADPFGERTEFVQLVRGLQGAGER